MAIHLLLFQAMSSFIFTICIGAMSYAERARSVGFCRETTSLTDWTVGLGYLISGGPAILVGAIYPTFERLLKLGSHMQTDWMKKTSIGTEDSTLRF